MPPAPAPSRPCSFNRRYIRRSSRLRKKQSLSREEAPLRRDDNGRYSVEWDSFTQAARASGMFILCNPHNPAGRVFTRAELARMAEICLESGTIICADEMHSDLLFDGHEHIPIASLDASIAQRTITLTGPSKTFNLARGL